MSKYKQDGKGTSALSFEAFGEELGLSGRSVRRAVDRREIVAFKIGGVQRIPRSELERLLASAHAQKGA